MTKKKSKKPIVYTFIDAQNLNLGTSKNIYKKGKLVYKGWKLDFKKFYTYLTDKFRIDKAFLFIGYVYQHRNLYKKLKRFGYTVIFKPTVKDHEGKPKGNVDAELVLYSAAIEYTNYDKAIIVSGDGDFCCLHEFLIQKEKLENIIIPNQKSESSLLKKLHQYKIFLQFEKEKLELTIKNGRRRS